MTALTREAGTLGAARERRPGYEVLADGTLRTVSGIGAAAAAAAAQRLLEAGAAALISWGVAGGLEPGLEAGAVCLPRAILGPEGRRFATASVWREQIAASIASDRRTITAGLLLTRAQPVTDVAAKAALRLETGAVAVDMESSAIAQVAAAGDLPFVAVRVIVDTARDAIPSWVVAAGETGQVRIARLLAGLMRSPRDLGDLLRLAKRYGAATRSLRAAAAGGRLMPPAGGGAPPLEGRD